MEGDEWWFDFEVREDDPDGETEQYLEVARDFETLSETVQRVGERDSSIDCRQDWSYRKRLVLTNMGSLKLCQLDRGTLLRECGAIGALISTLFEMEDHKTDPEAVDLIIACWGAVRDLACGDHINRALIRKTQVDGANGLELLVTSLERYHLVFWKDMTKQELALVTTVIGVLRNLTHWTPENCEALHSYGVTGLLVWRLLHGSGEIESALPGFDNPWREASYRCSNTLINMADEHKPCALEMRNNPVLVQYLAAEWSSNKRLAGLFDVLLSDETPRDL